MSFRLLQFSPQASSRVIRMRAVPQRWSSPTVDSRENAFLNSFLEEDGLLLERHLNWGAISGLALSLAVSAGFWAGLALLVERIWK